MDDPGRPLQLDAVDRQILGAFRFGARLSNAEIARQIDVSEGTIRRRVAALAEAGVLKFVTITDPKTLGFNLYTLMGIKADGDKVAQIAHELAGLPQVPYAALSMGSFDIWIGALFRSTDEWLEFRSRLAKIEGIRDTETFQITRVLKQNFDWVVPDESLFGDGFRTHDDVAKGGDGFGPTEK